MILPGTRGTLLCFEDDIALAMPHVTRITSLPRSKTARPYPFAKPILYDLAAVGQVLRAHAGVGARARHTGETRDVLMVRATDVSAGSRHLRHIYTGRRALDLPVFGVVACVYWFFHRPRNPFTSSIRLIRHERHNARAEDREKAVPADILRRVSCPAYVVRPVGSVAFVNQSHSSRALNGCPSWRSQTYHPTTRPTVDRAGRRR